MVDVAVDGVVRPGGPQRGEDGLPVTGNPVVLRTADQSRSESLDFGIECGRLVRVDEEVELYPSRIGVPEQVHQPGLHTTTVHGAHHVQNPFRPAAHGRLTGSHHRLHKVLADWPAGPSNSCQSGAVINSDNISRLVSTFSHHRKATSFRSA